MRNAFLVIAILGSILVTASETRAQCACAAMYVNITPRDEFNLAYAVFVGNLVSIKNTPRDKNDRYVETVTFQVTKAWKHDVNSNLKTGHSELIAAVQGPRYWRRLTTM